ncbi:MAG: efflux RND transporter periplasmic adaptor subunit [Treponema sp.]|nr:efflux RND transporter periplasmic adaptor subunit [Treponema sp.]
MTRNFFIWVFVLPALVFSACAEKGHSEIEARKVRGAAAVIRELPDEAEGFGTLSFLAKVDITSSQEGVISKLYFREGDYVRSGAQVLLIENPQIKLAVERAENNYSQAQAACDLARSRLLEGKFMAEAQLLAIEKSEAELLLIKRKWEEDKRKFLNQETLYNAGGINTEAILVSRFNLDMEWEQILIMEKELCIRMIGCRDQDLLSAGIPVPLDENERRSALVSLMTLSLTAELNASIARFEAAEKELSSVRIALEDLNVRAPASGIVGARYLEEGERVKPGDKIFSLMDTASLYAFFPVREKDAIRIEKGMAAFVKIDGTGEVREGVVDLVYPQADTQSLSFLVRVLLNDSGNGGGTSAGNRLKPGMFARSSVTLGPPRPAVFIHESAVFNKKNDEGSVFVVNGSVAGQRAVKLGPVTGEEREIISGLNAGEIVILRPESDLREGAYVALAE